jgi:hypothetical protein
MDLEQTYLCQEVCFETNRFLRNSCRQRHPSPRPLQKPFDPTVQDPRNCADQLDESNQPITPKERPAPMKEPKDGPGIPRLESTSNVPGSGTLRAKELER